MSRRFILGIDILLLLLLLLLLAPRLTEISLHEWIGILIIPIIFFHLLLSWRWLQLINQGFIQASVRTKINYVFNFLLFILVVLATISGIFISHVAVPFLSVETVDDQSWHILHRQTLLWLRILLGLHIAMNWKWIFNAVRNFGQTAQRKTSNLEKISFKDGAYRIFTFFVVACFITMAAWLILGAPTQITVELYLDPISRFAGDPWRGVKQFMSQIVFLGVVAIIGRRWFRVRL